MSTVLFKYRFSAGRDGDHASAVSSNGELRLKYVTLALAFIFLLMAASPGVSQSAQTLPGLPELLVSDFSPSMMEAEEGHPSVLRCLTPHIIEYEQNGDIKSRLRPEIAELLKASPTIMQDSFISPSGRFQLHYDVTGTHAVPLEDSNNSGIPDYVEFAAAYADSTYNYLVLQLGFVDFLIEGHPYDIYFRNFRFYGVARPTNVTIDGTTYNTTFIEVHHNFNGFPQNRDPDGHQLGSLKVTIAHELKHAIQYATNQWRGNAGTVNWAELDATMTEEIVFPTVKDYLNYLNSTNSVFRGAHNGIPGSYEQATFGLYYAERFGPEFWVDVWEEIRISPLLNVFTAMRTALEARGADFSTEFANNLMWHMASGSRSRPGFGFRDRALYPSVFISQTSSALPYVSPAPIMRAYSARFYEINHPSAVSGEIAAAIVRANNNQSLALIGFGADASVNTSLLNSSEYPTIEGLRTGWNWETMERVGFVFINSGASSGFFAQFLAGQADDHRSIIPFGDINRDGRLNLADADEIIMRVIQSPGPAITPQLPPAELRINDVSGNGNVSLFDAAMIKQYVLFGPGAVGSDGGFPADPDKLGWFPAISTMQTPAGAPAANLSVIFSDEAPFAASAETSGVELFSRFEQSNSPDNDTLRVFVDLAQREYYASLFSEIGYDSSLVKLERVTVPSAMTNTLTSLFYETNTGARVAAISADASIHNTILELVFTPLKDTVVTIRFDRIDLDERFTSTNIPEVTVRVQPKEGVNLPYFVDIPAGVQLLPAYPNPFNPSTTIPFKVDQPAFAEIVVFDQIGRQVETLFSGNVASGEYLTRFSGQNLASGVYLIQLRVRYSHSSQTMLQTQKVTLIK